MLANMCLTQRPMSARATQQHQRATSTNQQRRSVSFLWGLVVGVQTDLVIIPARSKGWVGRLLGVRHKAVLIHSYFLFPSQQEEKESLERKWYLTVTAALYYVSYGPSLIPRFETNMGLWNATYSTTVLFSWPHSQTTCPPLLLAVLYYNDKKLGRQSGAEAGQTVWDWSYCFHVVS